MHSYRFGPHRLGHTGCCRPWPRRRNPSRAETWPQRTVRLIVPLPPGAGTDLAARLFAERLAQRWGQPVIVRKSTRVGRDSCALAFLAAQDGHTLMFSFAGLITINPLIHDKLPYDPARDLVPIASAVDWRPGCCYRRMHSFTSRCFTVSREPEKSTFRVSLATFEDGTDVRPRLGTGRELASFTREL